MSLDAEIRSRLADLAAVHLEIIDDSHLHAGHAGNRGGGHFRLVVVSDCFVGKNRLDRQRMVHDKLRDLLAGAIHALSISAYTAEEFAHKTAQRG